jgi:hypothetical protein
MLRKPDLLPPDSMLPRTTLLRASIILWCSVLPILRLPTEIYASGALPLQPVPVRVLVERGRAVEIPLQVYGGGHESVIYQVRSAPRYGTLSDSRMIDANHGIVTYRHSGDFGHDRDIFYFAAKSITGVSARVSVIIEIMDRPPKLVAPINLEFGGVLIGTGAAIHVTFSNEGGGIDRGRVTATAPWSVAGDPEYAVGPDETAVVVLVCSPTEEGELNGTMQFSSSPATSVMLHATAIPPIRISPPTLELTLNRDSRIRSGAVRIENSANIDQAVEINGDESLGLPRRVSLPRGVSTEIPLQTKPDHLAAIDKTVQLIASGYSTQLQVTAPAVPAIVELDKKAVDFGEVSMWETAESFFIISNRGGEKAFLHLSVPPPFSLADGSARIQLEPGQTREIGISLRPESWGNISGSVTGKGFEIEFSVRLAARTPHPGTDKTRPEPQPRSIAKVWDLLEEKLPPLGKVQLKKVTGTTATITWTTRERSRSEFRLEARILNIGKETKKAEIRWIPFSDFRFERIGTTIRGIAKDLTPGGSYNVRVVELDSHGRIVRASRTIQIVTAPERRFAITPLRVLFAILTGVIAFMAVQRVQQRRETGSLARVT